MVCEQQLQDQLVAELKSLRTLEAALNLGNEALVSNDTAKIEETTREYNRAIQHHLALKQPRESLTSGEPDQENAFKALLSHHSNKSVLFSLYDEINCVALICQSLNRANAKLIHEKQNHTQQALDILRHTETTASLYSSRGNSSSTSNQSKSLGKA